MKAGARLSMVPLAPGGLQVWRCALDDPLPANGGLEDRLSIEEISRAERFRFEPDRHRFLLRRIVLREILGAYLDLDPTAIAIERDPRGKPHLPARAARGLEFNTSRAGEVGLIVVAGGLSVGVDIARVATATTWREAAALALNARELAWVASLPIDLQDDAFYALWTRKEAVAKAAGMGLQVDPPSLIVPVLPGTRGWLPVRPPTDGGEEPMTLTDLDAGPGYRACLAVNARLVGEAPGILTWTPSWLLHRTGRIEPAAPACERIGSG